MTDTTHIRRRPDGSIDAAHYVQLGRARRSETAREMAGSVSGPARKPLFALGGLLALIPFIGGHG